MAGKNTNIAPITGLATIPAGVAKAGTLDSDGLVVIGTGTDFQSLRPGDWIYDAAQVEVRRIESISKTETTQLLNINEAFTADLAAVPLVVVSAPEISTVTLFIKAGLADGVMDGNTLPSGLKVTVGSADGPQRGKAPIDPIVVNGTGTSVTVVEVK